jgi:hypothetical protein
MGSFFSATSYNMWCSSVLAVFLNPFGTGVAVVQDSALEAEADRMGHIAALIGQ